MGSLGGIYKGRTKADGRAAKNSVSSTPCDTLLPHRASCEACLNAEVSCFPENQRVPSPAAATRLSANNPHHNIPLKAGRF